MAKCRECYWAKMSDIGNPMQKQCIADRKDIEGQGALKTRITGKLVNTDDEACELFKPKGKRGENRRDLDA